MKYSNSPYNAPCPICAHIQNKLLYKVSSKEAANHFFVTMDINTNMAVTVDNKIAQLWNTITAAVVTCGNCDFVFSDPFIAGDHEFYNLLPHSIGGEAECWKWEFDKTFKKIASLTTNNNDLHLLEIGASTGDFVRRIARIIPKQNILCLEPSEIGVNSINKLGIETHSWDFRELMDKPGFTKKFDIVCLFQVLEHLNKIDETFETFNSVIKPGGHLFIGVPNEKKIKFNELNDALLDMPPNHVARYNYKNFKFLGNKYGWQIEEIAIEPFSPLDVMKTVMYYRALKSAQFPKVEKNTLYRIKQYLKIKKMRVQSFFLHKQLGETLWVHCRKLV